MMLLTSASPEEVREQLERRLDAKKDTIEGRVTRTQIAAWMADGHRRLWSPSLEVNCRAHPRGTLVVGMLGPHMFLYSLMIFAFIGTGFIAAVSTCWAYVQWSLHYPPNALFGLLPLGAALAFFAGLDRVGRRRAHPQMVELAGLLHGLGETVVDEEGVLREAEPLRYGGELRHHTD